MKLLAQAVLALCGACGEDTAVTDPVVDAALADSNSGWHTSPDAADCDACAYFEGVLSQESNTVCIARWTGPEMGFPWGVTIPSKISGDGTGHAFAVPTWTDPQGHKGVLLIKPGGCFWDMCTNTVGP